MRSGGPERGAGVVGLGLVGGGLGVETFTDALPAVRAPLGDLGLVMEAVQLGGDDRDRSIANRGFIGFRPVSVSTNSHYTTISSMSTTRA